MSFVVLLRLVNHLLKQLLVISQSLLFLLGLLDILAVHLELMTYHQDALLLLAYLLLQLTDQHW